MCSDSRAITWPRPLPIVRLILPQVIAQALAELKTQATLDGEIVALDETGFPRFEWLVNRGPQKGTFIYYVFDLLRRGRRSGGCHSSGGLSEGDSFAVTTTEGLATYVDALALGLEGVVAKDSKSPYVEGPRETSYWLKIKDKNYERQEKIDFHPKVFSACKTRPDDHDHAE